MKKVLTLQHYLILWEHDREIARFREYYTTNGTMLKNLKPMDLYEGRGQQILDRWKKIKQRTLRMRRELNLGDAECLS